MNVSYLEKSQCVKVISSSLGGGSCLLVKYLGTLQQTTIYCIQFRMLLSDLDGTLKLIVSRYKISPEESYVGRKLKSNVTTLLHQPFLSYSREFFLRVTLLNLNFIISNDTYFISIWNSWWHLWNTIVSNDIQLDLLHILSI